MSGRKEFRDLATPETAREAIMNLEIAPGTETVALREARGRVLADRVDADRDVPGFDRASMDGYAVRAADTFGADEGDPAVLTLVGEVHAGAAPESTVGEGEAVEISTGAVLPDGADAVVMVERTDLDDAGGVLVRTGVAPGDNVMFAGADVAAGERTLGPGTVLTPREIGLLAAIGMDRIPVRARPRVGIVSTGDELVRPGEMLDPTAGEIYDVNSYTVATAVDEAGGVAELYAHAGDDVDELEAILRRAAAECDLVLSSGSTSASAVDVVYRVIEDLGELILHGVAVKPGKPMLVGRLDGSAYVGLPGYPVSALTIFRIFVAPAIRQAADKPAPRTATVDGRMAVRERYGEGRLRLLPVGLVRQGEDVLVYPVDKGSGATTSLVEADGVVEVPADTAFLDRGEEVRVQLFSPDVRPPTVFAVGEDDPAFTRILDRLDRPRYLAVGTREAVRRLREGIPDAAVVAGPHEPDLSATRLATWSREWGLLVPSGNPDEVTGLPDVVDRELQFVNRTTAAGLRETFDAALGDLAADRNVDRATIETAIAGYDWALRAHESPARRVLAGTADVALGLRATAASLDMGFVSIGVESVRVLANPDRSGEPGLAALEEAVGEAAEILTALPGYDG